MLLVYTVPLAKRPQFQGLFGAVYGISSVIGPFVGGAFTSNVTWRWAFYLNVPLGGVVFLFILLLLEVPRSAVSKGTLTWSQKLQHLDLAGRRRAVHGLITKLTTRFEAKECRAHDEERLREGIVKFHLVYRPRDALFSVVRGPRRSIEVDDERVLG